MEQRKNDGQPARLDRAVQSHIGMQLRHVYEEVDKLPITNEHVDLILALRRKERDRKRPR